MFQSETSMVLANLGAHNHDGNEPATLLVLGAEQCQGIMSILCKNHELGNDFSNNSLPFDLQIQNPCSL